MQLKDWAGCSFGQHREAVSEISRRAGTCVTSLASLWQMKMYRAKGKESVLPSSPVTKAT